MNEPTPGPYKPVFSELPAAQVITNHLGIEGETIAHIRGRSRQESQANALLLSASYEMYNTLKEVYETVEKAMDDPDPEIWNYMHEIENLCCKARAKAVPLDNLKVQLQLVLELSDDQFDTHESDLYVLHSPELETYLSTRPDLRPKLEHSNVEGQAWLGKRFYDFPFANADYWDKKAEQAGK